MQQAERFSLAAGSGPFAVWVGKKRIVVCRPLVAKYLVFRRNESGAQLLR